MKVFSVPLLAVLLLSMPNCAPPPPNLTPAAVTAFDNDRIETALNVIRDTVQKGARTTPPVVARADADCVTKVHRSTVLTLEARAAGWQTLIKTGLDEGLKTCGVPPKTADLLAPYVSLVKVVIDQVAP